MYVRLPAVSMVAFWWRGWPGTKLRPSLAAVVAFTVMLQLTLVNEHWLFDEWPTVARYWQVLVVAVLTGLIFGGLLLLRGRLDHEWITNGVCTAVILYVVVWRRWPMDRSEESDNDSAARASTA